MCAGCFLVWTRSPEYVMHGASLNNTRYRFTRTRVIISATPSEERLGGQVSLLLNSFIAKDILDHRTLVSFLYTSKYFKAKFRSPLCIFWYNILCTYNTFFGFLIHKHWRNTSLCLFCLFFFLFGSRKTTPPPQPRDYAGVPSYQVRRRHRYALSVWLW